MRLGIPITKEEVEQAFKKGGFTINERFPECGFVYFPASKPRTSKNPDQGRVSWLAEEEDDTISISPNWGFPTEEQNAQILRLLALYVTYVRQVRAAA